MTSRRDFLEGAAALGLASAVACSPEVDPYADAATSVAAIGIGGDVEAAVRRAVEAAGGLSAIQPGQTVFIKPNAVGTVPGSNGFVTSLAVLGAVVRIVKERDPGWIVVGDRSEAFLQKWAA